MTNQDMPYGNAIMPRGERKTVQVQLAMDKPDEKHILDIKRWMAGRRGWKELFLRAIEIVWGLENHDFAALVRWYGAALSEYMNKELDSRLATLEKQVADLQEQIRVMNLDRQRVGLPPMEAPPAPKPTFILSKSNDIDPAARLLKSLGVGKK